MSLLRRLSRALETVSRPQLDDRSLFGALGEEYASQFLDGPGIVSRVVNPIIPNSDRHRNPFESDFLVYTQGNLFCIEVKRYKGRITYARKSRTSSFGEHGRNAHSQRIGQENINGVDKSTIVQEKTGNYGEPLPPKMHPNPLRKTRTFIRFLKDYLAENADARFRTLFIIPVVAFVEEADISAIHSFEEGMIYVRELPTFFQQHAHPTFARSPSAWVAKGIQKLPASDLIVTTDDEPFKGYITDSMLSFKRRDGQPEQTFAQLECNILGCFPTSTV